MPRVPIANRPADAYEIHVISGRDAGLRFDVEGREVPIGRDAVPGAEHGSVLLTDPTVSARQAVIHAEPSGAILEHRAGATNPTLVNGQPIARRRLASGDRIQIGVVTLEFRFRSGTSRQAGSDGLEEGEPWGRLLLARGGSGAERREFRLRGELVSIGRSPDCDVEIHEVGVSRLHAKLVWEGGQLFVDHCSRTNSTYVNGIEVPERVALVGNAEIQLADGVVLRLEHLERDGAVEDRTALRPAPQELPAPTTSPGVPTENPGLLTSLHARIEHEQELRGQLARWDTEREDEIDRKFGFTGTFLDIDVVNSYGMKARASRSDYIIISFERFRKFVSGVITEFDGEVLNSNGDELMCFFESPMQAIRAASAVRTRLEEFNRAQNLLTSPFHVRQGAHTGHSLVDRKRRVAYSPILDVAGHLQKEAETDGLLISQQTLEALPEGLPFERIGELEREGIPTHRLTGVLD